MHLLQGKSIHLQVFPLLPKSQLEKKAGKVLYVSLCESATNLDQVKKQESSWGNAKDNSTDTSDQTPPTGNNHTTHVC